MRKALGFTSLMIASVALILVVGPSCKAEESTTGEESEIRFDAAGKIEPVGDADEVTEFPVLVAISLLQETKEGSEAVRAISVRPQYPVICGGDFKCEGTEIMWLIGGRVPEGHTLVIRNADEANKCFDQTKIPVTISGRQNSASSGTALPACEKKLQGHFWQYVVELYKDGEEKPVASSDPGGIIHKRR